MLNSTETITGKFYQRVGSHKVYLSVWSEQCWFVWTTCEGRLATARLPSMLMTELPHVTNWNDAINHEREEQKR